ncbi:hypothetical protein HCI99_12925 [Listeria booriae]|uniref:Uncharacterized protein n=1 Tax=Listeria booriae TaxID=1552123 RepID=A0A7X1CCR1_9LIST|nr:hypothetical protein [Listeria booriae]
MIGEVIDEASVNISGIVRKKLDNKKVLFNNIQKLLDGIANFVSDDSGLKTEWILDQQSFQKNETTFYAAGYEICTYRIKYNKDQDIFIATEVI